jgi:multiple sugar transport system ATP-binding protein
MLRRGQSIRSSAREFEGGLRVNDLDPKDRNMAMAVQSYRIYPHMAVRENWVFSLRWARTDKREIARRSSAPESGRRLGACRSPRSQVPQPFRGQRQRVAMVRAIVREPDAFLLDEPLSKVDGKPRVQMRTKIARMQRDLGTTR